MRLLSPLHFYAAILLLLNPPHSVSGASEGAEQRDQRRTLSPAIPFPASETGISGPVHALATLPNGDMAVLAGGGLFVHDGAFWNRLAGVDWPEALQTLPNGRALVACAQGIVALVPNEIGSYDAIRQTSAKDIEGLHPLKSVALARGSLFGLHGATLLEVDRWGATTRHQLPNWSNGLFVIGDELYFLGGSDGGISRWDFQKKEVVNIGHFTELVNYAWTLRLAPRAEGGVWILVDSQQIIGFDGQKSWIWPGSEVLTREAALVHGFAETAPGCLAVGTEAHGLLLFDGAGEIEGRITQTEGLDSPTVTHVVQVAAGATLWGSSPGGLFRVGSDASHVVSSANNPAASAHASSDNEIGQSNNQESDSMDIRETLAHWGLPVIEAMYPLDTGIRGSAHAVVTLPQGELAVLTDSGLFVFDGARWYRQPEVDSPYHLLNMADDNALVGCAQGIVEITPSPTGGYQTKVLTPPESMKGLHAFMDIAVLDGRLFGLRGDQLLETSPDGAYQRHDLPNWASGLFTIDGNLYFAGGGNGGINRWDPETKGVVDLGHLTQPVEYAWPLETATRQEGGVWILFDSNRVMGFDGQNAWLWPGSNSLASRGIQVKSLVEYAPGKLAFGTASEGLLFFDEQGNFSRQISKSHGLEDVNVAEIGMDAKGDLWATTKTAISRVSMDHQTLVLDERHGLTESVNDLAFFRNRLYVGTAAGLFVSADQPPSLDETFTLLDGNRGVTDLLVHDNHLFIAGGQLKVMDSNRRLYQLSPEGGTNFLQPSRHPNLVLAGNYKGVQSFAKAKGRWILKETLAGPGSEIFSMAESADGLIWGGLGIDRVARISLDENGNGRIENMPIASASPIGWSIVAQIENEVYLNTEPCLRWDVDAQAWAESPSMEYSIGGFPFGFAHVFGRSKEDAFVTLQASGGAAVKRPNARLLGMIASLGNAVDARANTIAVDEEGTAWIGGAFGLLRALDPYVAAAPLSITPRIHRLISLKDSAPLPFMRPDGRPLTLRPRENSLRIEMAMPNFASHRHNQYQIYVEGLDSAWPEFADVPFREVTNLEPGNYLLRIQGRDASGRQTPLLDLPLILLPRWYEHPWAYLLYALAAASLIGGIVSYSTKRHVRRAKQLEVLVAERTQEIEAQKRELVVQAETLEKQNLELAEKTDELETTTESLTETLHQLQEAQEQLVATARTAGKAEIATNVLHNVGNVLNSINVSLSTLSQRVSRSNLPKLSKLADLIEEKRQDIANFLSSDPRGKRVPDYLNNLARALNEESASIAYEISSMEEEVEHIKRIIAAQQTHAKAYSLSENVDIRELCNTAFNILGSYSLSNRVEIVNEVPDGLVVHTDKHRALEIILNLISNAQEAIDAHPDMTLGSIIVSAARSADDQRVVLTVADNGVGMEANVQASVFTHGFTTKPTGHGFGLHSAANAAKALGGELALASPGPNQGATATLTLPRSPAHPSSSSSSTSPSSSSSTSPVQL